MFLPNGYVGIATAVGLAEQGREVVLVEQDPERLAALADGRDLIVICAGTPIDETGSTDVSQVARALDAAIPAMNAGAACVIRSTLPVGSAARLANRPGGVPEHLFVAPEFLRQGSALDDIRRPTRVVVGTFGAGTDPAALALVTGALAQPGTPLLVMRAEEASLVKNASNVFLALRLTFANEVAGLAQDLGVDVGPVLEGIGHDPRIGHAYIRPSYGFDGSCLPKEVRSLSSAGLDRGLPMHLAGRSRMRTQTTGDASPGASPRRSVALRASGSRSWAWRSRPTPTTSAPHPPRRKSRSFR